MTAAPVEPCPVCATPTEGLHIAGSVYDFTCQTCADEADAGFRGFVDRLLEELGEQEHPPSTTQ